MQPGLSADAHSMMLFEANKKSVGVAYALWFFLGMLGAHRFYSNHAATGLGILALTFLGCLTLAAGVGAVLVAAAAIWVLVDLFLISGWIRKYNMDLVSKLVGGARIMATA
jgi:TM2 domain-containing membrane protein YozV